MYTKLKFLRMRRGKDAIKIKSEENSKEFCYLYLLFTGLKSN